MARKPKSLSLKPWLAILGVVSIGAIVTRMGWQWACRPVVTAPATEAVYLVIPKGASVDAIGQQLKEAGVIRSPACFKMSVIRQGIAKQIQAGGYKLTPTLSVDEITQALTKGQNDIWVTLLEGWRREEIASAVTNAFNEAGSLFSEATFLALTEDKEGYLFPDTYLFPLDATEATTVSILENTFAKRMEKEIQPLLNQSKRTSADVVIMASLVEREAKSREDRPIVAGILWKRLESGWPLQVDATLQYAKGYNSKEESWWTPPAALDKSINSPYNTYQNPGLPPTPICSPSLASLKAAVSPQTSTYWYYLTDNEGTMHYAQTLEEHTANINRYLR